LVQGGAKSNGANALHFNPDGGFGIDRQISGDTVLVFIISKTASLHMIRAESDSFLLANYQANSSVIYRIFSFRETRRLAMTPRNGN
jgi:hypothetical protein